jgi:hypothetical protein
MFYMQYWLSENLPLHVRRARSYWRITLNVDQILHCVQTEEINYKNLFLQTDHVPSKHELPVSYNVVVKKKFVALSPDIFETLLS